ncbi:hypothetical protein [Ottowia testudinis]|uniref:Uncharacterized protein n=1 Tax=Ottowia testudinis TaxID=2816950 RepID=A0A975CEA4_9BURK|nr:hypothetical protein [Ottowia testudinis]QTD44181.1 hypothetical protein J1M35_13725 [Ottowia testudinis]
MTQFEHQPATHTVRGFLAVALLAATGAALAQGGQVIQGAPDSGIRLGKSVGQKPTHVCIDFTSHAAWSLFYSTADTTCAKPGMERIALAEFASPAIRGKLRQRVLMDAFAGYDVPAQINGYLKLVPGGPIALTWDGGMAIQATDYSDAEKRHAVYIKDPAAYEKQAGFKR